MQRQSGLVLACLILIPSVAWSDESGARRVLPLGSIEGTTPRLTVTNSSARGLSLEFGLPLLEVEEDQLDGQPCQTLSIPDGGQRGQPGEAALPTYTRLLQVPGGARVSARVVDKQERILSGYRLAPQQPVRSALAGEAKPLWSPEYYARATWDEPPAVVVGEPAILRDLVVVPVTFQPVRYRPAAGELSVATSISVELSFNADALGAVRAPAGPPRRMVPSSYAALYREFVLGYDSADADVGLGSYLVICPDNAAVVTSLGPLLDWRRRQGYNVALVTTALTGSTNAAIKSYIQNAYDNWSVPLEFVVLVGDANGAIAVPTWFEGLSGYGGEGDHYYTTLAGSDILPDVHVGRLSVTSTAELDLAVGKIVGYESTPAVDADPPWFRRASLAGDGNNPSGITCVFTNQWAKNQLLRAGYSQVDTIWSGNFVTQMLTNLNRGCTIFTYRGYYGMSGMTATHILTASNGKELPFAVILTCDTGSFSDDVTCRSEAFLRAADGGGIGAIGTATTGTHTRYNNVIFGGIIHGVINTGEHRLGPALTHGKIELYRNYFTAEPASAEIWAVWNNLMGDPATECWTGFPMEMTVNHVATLPTQANGVPVNVWAGGEPLPGARVALHKGSEISLAGLTDAAGTVNLPVSGLTAGPLSLTVTEHARRPYLGVITIGAAEPFVGLTQVIVVDDGTGQSVGNGDGEVNPAETVQVEVALTNHGTSPVSGVTAALAVNDPYVSVVAGAVALGDLSGGATAWGDQPLVLAFAPGTLDGHVVRGDLLAAAGSQSWSSLLELRVRAPAPVTQGMTFGGPGGNLDPGEYGPLTVDLRNDGSVGIVTASATLLSRSPWVTVTDGAGTYGAIAVGGTGANGADPFGIAIEAACFRGHLAALDIALAYPDGGVDTVSVLATVGTLTTADPVGPDHHGYYALDNTDTAYPDAPAYAWLEIDPGLGGAGASVGVTDFGWEQDSVRTLDLPFPFTYYGKPYSGVSICSNGWLALGATYLRDYRNLTLPSDGSPDALIAVFWDNLYLSTGAGGVFSWFDAANHRFVVEWSRLLNDWNGSLETFEAILYDPAYHATDTGDGIIVCQYHTVNNVDSENGYASVGIQNVARDDGLLYTYWNRYAGGAATLSAGRAIKFVALSPQAPGYLEGVVSNASGGGTPISGAQVRVVERNRILQSQADGHYAGSVPPGTYTLFVEHPSFRADTVSAVTIFEGLTEVRNFALTDVVGPSFTATTSLPNTTDEAGPYVIESLITDLSPVAERRLYYTSSADGGVAHELPLVLVDVEQQRFRAEIPGQPLGARVQYWLVARDAVGNVGREPSGAPWTVHAFQVADVSVILSDDMENDLGWIAGVTGDDATTGLWERVDPNGVMNGTTQVQPEDDATPAPGVMCWVTGNDPPGSSQGVLDVDGGRATLLSPQYNLSAHSGVSVGYKRWYTNDTGLNPGQDTWRVDVTTDGTNWVALESTNASDRSWYARSFLLSDFITVGGLVQLRFIAEDLAPGSIVEAGVDDFVLMGYTQIDDTGPPLVDVATPDGGEVIPSATVYSIAWSASDDIGIVSTALVLSTDGGASFPDTLAAGALGTSWEWSVPNLTSANCRLKVICSDSRQQSASDLSGADFAIVGTTGVVDTPLAPARLELAPNRPNPFNPATEIRCALPTAQRVSLRVFNAAGRLVATLADGDYPAGHHLFVWRGADDRGARVASGAYFYRLETATGALTRKMMLVK